MIHRRSIDIPSVVRIKPGALDRLGIYLRRQDVTRVALFRSEGLPPPIVERVRRALDDEGVRLVHDTEVRDNSIEEAQRIFVSAERTDALVGLGGGKALDVAKYVGFLSETPTFSVPASLSNDGFCSPQSSLTVAGDRRSLPSSMPFAVVVDTEVCVGAPEILWWSGVGDLVAKITAVEDWRIAFHAVGTPVDDFAALLSDSTVFQFMARPERDLEGTRLLATALMLNGVSMAVCGSSRPASGSEHLVSHALDAIGTRPRPHGLQVGVATYLMARLQERTDPTRIADLFERTGFWGAIEGDPFVRDEWVEAIHRAPTLKQDFYTVLSREGAARDAVALLDADDRLARCFV